MSGGKCRLNAIKRVHRALLSRGRAPAGSRGRCAHARSAPRLHTGSGRTDRCDYVRIFCIYIYICVHALCVSLSTRMCMCVCARVCDGTYLAPRIGDRERPAAARVPAGARTQRCLRSRNLTNRFRFRRRELASSIMATRGNARPSPPVRAPRQQLMMIPPPSRALFLPQSSSFSSSAPT